VFGEWMSHEEEEVLLRSSGATRIDRDWDGLTQHAGIRQKVCGDSSVLPFGDGIFAVVSANMVIEHLDEPKRVLSEIRRVLEPGGVFVFHTPNLYHWAILMAVCVPGVTKRQLISYLEGRPAADVFNTHYRMNTASVVRRLAKDTGFELASLAQVSSSATLVMLDPFVIAELVYVRLLRSRVLAGLRSNLVVTLRKAKSS